jgi:hypothetical protein
MVEGGDGGSPPLRKIRAWFVVDHIFGNPHPFLRDVKITGANIQKRITLIGSEHFGDDAFDRCVFADVCCCFVGGDDRCGLLRCGEVSQAENQARRRKNG